MNKKIVIIAGEASGDYLGAELIAALKQYPQKIDFYGVGGAAMAEQGIKSFFPLADIAVMGLMNILPKIPLIRRRIRQTTEEIQTLQPDMLIVIDSFDFTHRVAAQIHKIMPHVKIVRYVAPKLWAWRPKRAEKLKGVYDALLVLFPFEIEFFKKFNIHAECVGHSVVNRLAGGDAFFLKTDHPSLLLLPGSRKSEITRLLPVFCETAVEIQKQYPDVEVVVPTLQVWQDLTQAIAADYPLLRYRLVTGEAERFAEFCKSHVALAASGTVSLELMVAGTPMVIAYKVGAVSAWLARRLICVPFVTLLNIMLNKKVIPEFLQKDCNARNLKPAVLKLLFNEEEKRKQCEGFKQGIMMLQGEAGLTPAETAAKKIFFLAFSKEKD